MLTIYQYQWYYESQSVLVVGYPLPELFLLQKSRSLESNQTKIKQDHRMRHKRPSVRGHLLVKKGHNSKTIAIRVIHSCIATAPCHDEQVFQVWC